MASGIFKNAKVSGAATSVATLYTVPSGKYSTVHSIFVTNRYNLEDLYGDILKVQSSRANSIDIIANVLEFTP